MEEADARGDAQVDRAHILLALMHVGDGLAALGLRHHGADSDAMRGELAALLDRH